MRRGAVAAARLRVARPGRRQGPRVLGSRLGRGGGARARAARAPGDARRRETVPAGAHAGRGRAQAGRGAHGRGKRRVQGLLLDVRVYGSRVSDAYSYLPVRIYRRTRE